MKIYIALLLTALIVAARAETLLLTGGTNHTLNVPVGKAAYFTGTFGDDEAFEITASVQIGSSTYGGILIGFGDIGTKLRVVTGPATVTFSAYSNAAVTYRFVTGVSSLILPPQQSQIIQLAAGRTLKTVYALNDSENGYPLRLRVTKGGSTVEMPYSDAKNNELTGPLTIQVFNDSPAKIATFAYSIIRPIAKLP